MMPQQRAEGQGDGVLIRSLLRAAAAQTNTSERQTEVVRMEILLSSGSRVEIQRENGERNAYVYIFLMRMNQT